MIQSPQWRIKTWQQLNGTLFVENQKNQKIGTVWKLTPVPQQTPLTLESCLFVGQWRSRWDESVNKEVVSSDTGVSTTHHGTVWLSSHPTVWGGGRPNNGQTWRETVAKSLQRYSGNTAGGTEMNFGWRHTEWLSQVRSAEVKSLVDDVNVCRQICGNPSTAFKEPFQFLFFPSATKN